MNTTILLVDDDPNDVFFFNFCAKKAAIANPPRVVNDGREALDYLAGADKFADRQQHPIPWMVILDLKMPRVSGFEVLEHIRATPALRRLIVVVLTSSVNEEDINKAYDLGANAYLVKPADSRDLARMVQAIKDFWLTHTRIPT